jgi:F5/8 type C domain
VYANSDRRRPARAVAAVALLSALCVSAGAAESRARPYWGDEALWGYWEFADDYIPKKDWKIVSVSQEGPDGRKSQNLIDDDTVTFYCPSGKDSYEVVIDLGAAYELGAFTVVTLGRPNNASDSRMAKYELYVSGSKDVRGAAAAVGGFDGDEGKETVVTFPPVKGRYVTLKAFARPNADKEVCIREFCLVSADAVKRYRALKESADAVARCGDVERAAEERLPPNQDRLY